MDLSLFLIVLSRKNINFFLANGLFSKIHFIFTRIIFQINLLHIFPIFPPNSFSIWVPLSWKVSLFYMEKSCWKNEQKSIRFLRNGDFEENISIFVFCVVWRRWGVIEFTSEKWLAEKKDGKKIYGMGVLKRLLNFQVSMILTKRQKNPIFS